MKGILLESYFENKRLLHFFSDEKVVNDTISFFEECFPNKNLFVVLTKTGEVNMVNKTNNTLFLSYDSLELKVVIKKCYVFKEIVCHSIWYELSKIISKVEHPNITWIVWGADLYEIMLYRKGYQLYIDEKNLFKIRARKLPVWIYKLLVGFRDNIYFKAQYKAIKKIKTFSGLSCDYKLFVDYYPEFGHVKYKEFFYYPIERMLDSQTRGSFVSGNNIWINPAAKYNGNHIDIFQRVSQFRHLDKVCVPLSYGIPMWAKYYKQVGQYYLGSHFEALTTFLPKHEYYKLFLSSNSFVFGHLRQCAMGNIVIALYLGAKVFLFKQNVLYNFFKDKGVTLFSIDEDLTEENVYTPLSEDLRKRNRTIILEYFSYKNLLSIIKDNF